MDTKTIAATILSYNLKQVMELQFELAKAGICITFQTAEVVLDENPSLGKST